MTSKADLQLLIEAKNLASDVVKKVNKDVKQFADDTTDAAKKTSGFKGAMGDVVKIAAGFGVFTMASNAVGGLTDALKGAIGSAAAFETYETQFGVLLGSADKAKERLADLAEFGATTPFELPGVVEADKILQGFGLHSQEAAKKFGFSGGEIRRIAGDVAAGSGASFQEMAGYIGKFSSGATGEAIARFQELGIVTRDELKKMGLEFAKSGELLSPLPEATEVLLQAMKQKYGGMMEAQSATFEGMMSNLTDWIDNTKRALATPIFEALKGKLEVLLTFLNEKVGPALELLTTDFSAGVGKIAEIFGELGGKIVAELPKLVVALGKWVVTDGVPAMIQFGNKLAEGIAKGIIEGLASIAQPTQNAILEWSAGITGGATEYAAKKAQYELKESLRTTTDIVAEAGANITHVFTMSVSKTGARIADVLGGVNDNVKTAFAEMVKDADTAASKLSGALSKGFDALGKQAWMAAALAAGIQFAPITENPLQKLIDDAGKYGFQILNLEEMQTKLEGQIKATTDTAKAFWRDVAEGVQQAEKYVDSFGNTWDVVWNRVTKSTVAGGGATGGGAAAGNLESAIWSAETAWLDSVENMTLSIQELPNDSWAAFDEINTESTKQTASTWQKILDTVRTGRTDVILEIAGLWDGIKSEFDAGVNAAVNPINRLYQALTDLRNAWTGLRVDIGSGVGINVPQMAEGGIVTGPTLAIIGERGPEAIVPLSGRGSGGITSGIDYERLADAIARKLGGQQIILEIDGRTMARALRPYTDNMARITA